MEQLNSLIINNLQQVFQVKIEVINTMKTTTTLTKYFYSLITILLILVLSLSKTESINNSFFIYFPHLDKLIHLLMYFGLTSILLIENENKQNLLITISSIILSGLIELIQQNLTTYRSGDWFDLLSNSIGSATAFVVILNYYKEIINLKIVKTIFRLKHFIIQ